MNSLAAADWPQLEALRERVGASSAAANVSVAAQAVCDLFTESFDSIVLARLFLVLPFKALPAREQAFAERLVEKSRLLRDTTPTLCLLGTSGKNAAWRERANSVRHLAIPLLGAESVAGAPMIAKLLSDLNIDLKALDDGRPIATRQMLGGKNGVFYVLDAQQDRDASGRHIVADTAFVRDHRIATVFGMGGAYVDGTLAVMVVFCDEHLERNIVDRYASFIASFKMATTNLLQARRIFTD